MTMPVLGLDTSNYTTSAAVFDGADGCNAGRLLAVRPGAGTAAERRPVPACEAAPGAAGGAGGRGLLRDLKAVGASTRPRAVEGSYMPCFLAGESQGRRWPPPLGVPFLPAPTSRGTWRRRPGPPGGRTCWTVPSWPGTCPAAPPSCCWSGPRGTNVAAEAGRDQRHLRWPAHRPHRRPAGAPVPSWQSAGRALSSGGCLYGSTA